MFSVAVVSAEGESRDIELSLQRTMLVRSVLQCKPSAKVYEGTRESRPDLVLLDLSDSHESCLKFAADLQRLDPTISMVGCSNTQPSPDLLLRAMHCGIRDFLPKPINAEALREAFARLIPEGNARNFDAGKLIVVMGTSGGVGTSTVAVNLAVQLKRAAEKRVLLLDFGRPLGDDCLLLDLKPSFSVRDAAESADRMDAHFLAGLVSHHKSGLDVLAGSSSPEEWQHILTSDLRRVVQVAQSHYDLVIVDFGPFYSSEWNAVLAGAEILLVSEPNVSGLYKLQRYTAWLSSGIERCEVRLVINRWHRRDEEAVRAVEESLKQQVFARLPNDFAQVNQAATMGVPLSKEHKDPLTTRFREMACRLAEVKSLPEEKQGSLGRFSFSFLSSPRACQSGG